MYMAYTPKYTTTDLHAFWFKDFQNYVMACLKASTFDLTSQREMFGRLNQGQGDKNTWQSPFNLEDRWEELIKIIYSDGFKSKCGQQSCMICYPPIPVSERKDEPFKS